MASLRRKLLNIINYNVETPEAQKIYGIKRELNSTGSAWERTDDAVGLIANAQIGNTPVQNDFDSIYPWGDIISYNYDAANDRINAYYGDSGFAFDGSNGDVLTLIPEFYYKRWRDSSYEYIQISKDYFDGSTKSEEFSVGRYVMSGSSSRVYSKSGVQPLRSANITQYRTYARNLGNKFGVMDWHYFILQLLYLVEYADYDGQLKIAPGYSKSGHSGPINSGSCNFLGMKSGSVDGTDDSSMIYRGIEDIYGNIWELLDGINISYRAPYICYDSEHYAINTTSGYYSWVNMTLEKNTSFPKKFGYDSNNPLVTLVTEGVTASSGEYIFLDLWYGSNTGNRILSTGGAYGHGSNCGWFSYNANVSSSSTWEDETARIIKKS